MSRGPSSRLRESSARTRATAAVLSSSAMAGKHRKEGSSPSSDFLGKATKSSDVQQMDVKSATSAKPLPLGLFLHIFDTGPDAGPVGLVVLQECCSQSFWSLFKASLLPHLIAPLLLLLVRLDL